MRDLDPIPRTIRFAIAIFCIEIAVLFTAILASTVFAMILYATGLGPAPIDSEGAFGYFTKLCIAFVFILLNVAVIVNVVYEQLELIKEKLEKLEKKIDSADKINKDKLQIAGVNCYIAGADFKDVESKLKHLDKVYSSKCAYAFKYCGLVCVIQSRYTKAMIDFRATENRFKTDYLDNIKYSSFVDVLKKLSEYLNIDLIACIYLSEDAKDYTHILDYPYLRINSGSVKELTGKEFDKGIETAETLWPKCNEFFASDIFIDEENKKNN